MKKDLLKEILLKKEKRIEFAIVTNLKNGESFIFEKNKEVNKNFQKYIDKINYHFNNKKNGIIAETDLFIENYIRPIKLVIVGAVHIAQYLISFADELNFEISVVDPRGYFASEKRFPKIKIINDWPDKAFNKIKTNENTALVALTHDPKIDDPAIQYGLKNNFFYIGALGSKNTHENRCLRLSKSGFTKDQINKIHGPIGIKLGGKSAPEIALSIVSQLIMEIYKK